MTDFLQRSKDAFEASTSYLDANWRKDWDYSIRAFRNEHAQGSKYLSAEYAHRSKIFRPKTRSMIRKNEAAAAVAFFSNKDVINVDPGNPNDVISVASAEALKEVVQYRLTKTIPWFQVLIGALQDAQVQGVVCSYQYWEYEERDGQKVKDKPCIELRPVENLRFDPSANWMDPVNTSPYFCDVIPMYVCDVRDMMETEDPKTGRPKWQKYDDKEIALAKPETMDQTRQARFGQQRDPQEEESPITDFDTVWVLRWFMRDKGQDYTYYTLGKDRMLTDPKPIGEVYFHGKRPYVMGYVVLETHKPLKSSIPVLSRQIQMETNEVANQRIDNVKFVLNKRWIVARGRQVDVNSLVRNVPGGVTLTTDPNADIKESNWPDVTSSSYAEQDRLNADFDDIVGNFSGSSITTSRAMNETVGGMKLLNQGASLMTEYMLATFRETWVEPVLRQLVLLEQYYETDDVVLGIAADNAKLFPRFGISRITDMLMMKEVNLSVNVGMGSTNPNERMQKFIAATGAAMNLVQNAPPSANVQEMIKEIYANAGYRDGARFFGSQVDPRLPAAMQKVQQLTGMLQGKQMEMQQQAQIKQAEIASNERIKGAEIQVNAARIDGDLKIRASEIEVEKQRLELERLKLAAEQQGATQEQQMKIAEMSAKIEEAALKLDHERMRINHDAMKMQHEMEQDAKEAEATVSSEQRVSGVADQVAQAMAQVASEIADIRGEVGRAKDGLSELDAIKRQMAAIGDGITGMAGMFAMQPKQRKAVGFNLKKSGNKTTAVTVRFDDGQEEEMPVGTIQ